MPKSFAKPCKTGHNLAFLEGELLCTEYYLYATVISVVRQWQNFC